MAGDAAWTGGLRVASAVKTIDGIRVLDAVSFAARPGRITALLGPNGAGKSTVLGALAGQIRLDAGRALVADKPIARHRDPLRVLGALPPVESLHPGRTAAGHLRTVATIGGIGRDRVTHVLRVVGLGALADVRVGEMSLGMRQRLALAVALIAAPAVLILDEPHNGLDATAIRWLRAVLRSYADSGRTVLIASHLLAEVQYLADDVVLLDGGRVTAGGPVAEILDSPGGTSPSTEDSSGGALEEWYFDKVGVSA